MSKHAIIEIILIVILLAILFGGIPIPRWGGGADRVLYIVVVVVCIILVLRALGVFV
jgi:hypothetical protein